MIKEQSISGEFNFEEDQILSWSDVNKIHRIRNGVYQRKEKLISLLTDFGKINPCYPDKANKKGDRIFYTGEGRHGDQVLGPGNRALLAAIKSKHTVPLFNKLSVGRWQFMGHWRVTDGKHIFDKKENRMLWRFTLLKASGSCRSSYS